MKCESCPEIVWITNCEGDMSLKEDGGLERVFSLHFLIACIIFLARKDGRVCWKESSMWKRSSRSTDRGFRCEV